MAKNEKQESKQHIGARPTEGMPEWDHILKEMRTHFKSKAVLQKLVKAGCNEETVLKLLYLYCGGDPGLAQKAKQGLRQYRRRLLRLLEQVQQLSEEVEASYAVLEREFGIKAHFAPAEGIRSSAVFFERAAKVLREASSGRFSGRDQHLFDLVELVKRVTGREHYPEVADLVQATREKYATKHERVVDAESLRKVVDGYRRRAFPAQRRKAHRN